MAGGGRRAAFRRGIKFGGNLQQQTSLVHFAFDPDSFSANNTPTNTKNPKNMPAVTSGLVAVTGATGFVGSYVCKELLSRGFTVRAVVRDPSNEDKVAHLKAMANAGSHLQFARGNLMEAGSYDEAFVGCGAVVHCAARVHEQGSASMIPSHLEGTQNVLDSAHKAGTVRRFVQTSSIAAIQDPFQARPDPAVPSVFTERDYSDACTPEVGGFYATAKREAERLVHGFCAREEVGFDCVVLCPGVVIGACLCKAHTKASPVFIRQLLYGNEQFDVYMPWVDAEDVGRAHVEALVREGAADGLARFIVTSDFDGKVDALVPHLEELYPTVQFDAVHTPWWKWVFAWFFAWKFELAMVDAMMHQDNSLSKAGLGMEYADIKTSLKRTVDSMVDTKWVRARKKR
jgi:nucleoside-diphosphate-sugar epimerase